MVEATYSFIEIEFFISKAKRHVRTQIHSSILNAVVDMDGRAKHNSLSVSAACLPGYKELTYSTDSSKIIWRHDTILDASCVRDGSTS